MGNPIGTSYATLLADGGFTPQVQPSSYQVHENIYGGYLETDFKGTVFGLPWGAVAAFAMCIRMKNPRARSRISPA